MVLCPACEGCGPMIPVFVKPVEGKKPDLEALAKSDVFKCQLCKGTNEVTQEVADRWARGREFANKRKEACYGPREYADFLSILPSDLLDMEQGRKEPIEFVEPPIRTVTLSAREVRDLMTERTNALQQRDWLRLIFKAVACGVVYENDEGTTVVQGGEAVVLTKDENAVPIYDAEVEAKIISIFRKEKRKWP